MVKVEDRSIKINRTELEDILKFKPECGLTLDCVADGLAYPTQDNSNHLRKVAARIFKNILFENTNDDINRSSNYSKTAVNKAMTLSSSYLTRITLFLNKKLKESEILVSYLISKENEDYLIKYSVKRAVE